MFLPAAEELGVLVGLDLTLLICFTGMLVWYYRSPLVPTFMSIIVGCAWYLGFSGTLLLPADIADAMINGESSSWIQGAWYFIYWSTMPLAWLIIPVTSSAWSAGEFTWLERFRTGLRSNLRDYLIMAGVGGIIMIYLLASKQTSFSSLSGFVMALANTYGLLLIILLLGHGLVEIPRDMWIMSFPQRELEVLHFRATQLDNTLYEAIFDLDDIEKEVADLQRTLDTTPHSQVDPGVAQMVIQVRQTRDAFEEKDLQLQLDRRNGSGRTASNGRGRDDHSVNGGGAAGGGRAADSSSRRGSVSCKLSASSIVPLHARLRDAQDRVTTAKLSWDDLIDRVGVVQQIISGSLPYPRSTAGPGADFGLRCRTTTQLLLARIVWVWRARLAPRCRRAMAMICALFSVSILWSEVIIGVKGTNLSPFGQLLHFFEGYFSEGLTPIVLQAAALVPFLYMSVCCYRSLFKIKLFGSFELKPGHHSLPGPMLFNAQYLCRLQFSLGYNYLQVLGASSGHVVANTAFQSLMSNMEVVPLLGTDFNIYAPLIMVLLCIFTFFRGFARMMHFIGLEHEDLMSANDPEGKERLEEGRSLIERSVRQNRNREKRRAGREGVREAVVTRGPTVADPQIPTKSSSIPRATSGTGGSGSVLGGRGNSSRILGRAAAEAEDTDDSPMSSPHGYVAPSLSSVTLGRGASSYGQIGNGPDDV